LVSLPLVQVIAIFFVAAFMGDVDAGVKSTLRVLREKVKFVARKVLQISSEFTVTVAIRIVPSSEVI
jgi:hypothetical protein